MIIIDEPPAALGVKDTAQLYGLIQSLRDEGLPLFSSPIKWPTLSLSQRAFL